MASNYVIQVQYPGVDVLGGTQTQDVVFVGFTTIPHGTYVEAPVNASGYTATTVGLTAASWANAFEEVWGHDFVVGVQWAQLVNPSNQLENVAIVTVSSTSGNSANTVTIPMAQLPANAYDHLLADMHDQLDQAEAA